ncbi:MAG: hypothetical protein LBU87_01165 [Lactobacillales bacterium]|jgi:hypothetical protein|nr:hypothetical protein [Lactobacillales bacterium]
MTYKHTLILGGIYLLAIFMLNFIPNSIAEALSYVFLILFLFCNILLCFNKHISFLKYIYDKHKIFREYLIIIGWIPYVMVCAEFIFWVTSLFVDLHESVSDFYFYQEIAMIVLTVVSILYQTYLFVDTYCGLKPIRKKIWHSIKEFFNLILSGG